MRKKSSRVAAGAHVRLVQPAIEFRAAGRGDLDSHTATGILDPPTRLRRENEMTVAIAIHDPQIASRYNRLIGLRDGAVIDDIEISGGYPVDETIRRVGQLG